MPRTEQGSQKQNQTSVPLIAPDANTTTMVFSYHVRKPRAEIILEMKQNI